MDSCLNNLSPKHAKQFLEKHDFILGNITGDHFTYFKKKSNGKIVTVQVIDNNKQCYKSNTKRMIVKSEIPESEWANYKKFLKKH